MNWDFTNDSHIEVVDSVTIQGYRFSDGWARDQQSISAPDSPSLLRKWNWTQLPSSKTTNVSAPAVIARFDFHTKG